MCTAADQPASRNTHRFVNGSPPPIPRLDLEEKENEITPVVVVLVLMAGPDAPLSLCEPCCLTVHFFPSSFLFSFLSFFLFSKLLPLLLLSPSLDCKPLQDARTNESTARNKFTVDCFYSLSSLPSSLRGGAPSGREEAFARINRAVPFDTTSHHRTVPILSTAARRSSESIYTKKKKEEKTKQRSRVRSRFPRDARSSCIVEQSTILGSKAGTEIHPSIYFPRGWKSGRIVRLNGGWCSSTAVRLEFPSHTRVCPPIYERVHAPLYTRAQVRALTQYAPYIRAYLGGEVAKGLQGNCNTTDVAAVCKAVYYTVSHARD